MAYKALAIACGMIVAASPLAAAPNGPAPAAGPGAQYCMHVGPVTGRIAETIECWTREEWAEQDVDVDRDWMENGVRVIG